MDKNNLKEAEKLFDDNGGNNFDVPPKKSAFDDLLNDLNSTLDNPHEKMAAKSKIEEVSAAPIPKNPVMDEKFFESLVDEVNKQYKQKPTKRPEPIKQKSVPIKPVENYAEKIVEDDSDMKIAHPAEKIRTVKQSLAGEKQKKQSIINPNIAKTQTVQSEPTIKPPLQPSVKPPVQKPKVESATPISESVKIPTPAKNTKVTKNTKDTKINRKADDSAEDYDFELLKAFGFEDGEELSDDFDSSDAPPRRTKRTSQAKSTSGKKNPRLKRLFVPINGEYTSPEQNSDIFSGYQKIYYSEIIKFCVTAILLLFITYIEIAPPLGWKLPGALNVDYYNSAYILIDLQILLIVGALNLNSLIYGVKSIMAFGRNLYFISSMFFVLNFAFTIFTYFLRYNSPGALLFNSVSVFCMTLVSLHNILDINAEIFGFKVLSSKRPKYALSIAGNGCDPEMDSFRYIIPEDTPVGKVSRTEFVSGFLKNTAKGKNRDTVEKYITNITLIVSALVFIILLGIKVDLYNAGVYFLVIVSASIPLCSSIISILPVFKSQKNAYYINSAFIGEEIIDKCSEIQILSVHDRDIFPPDKIKIVSIKVYGNNRFETVLQYNYAAITNLNLGLSDMFGKSTSFESTFDRSVKILSIDEGGITYVSNGKKLYLGGMDYINKLGVDIPYDQNFDEQFEKSAGSIMILATETEVLSKVYIKYDVSPDFYDIIKNLTRANICLGIKTFDPNITNSLLLKLINTKKVPVKIIKMSPTDPPYKIDEKVNSSVISKSSLKSLISAFILCAKTKSTIKSNVLIQIIAFATGLLFTSGIIISSAFNSQSWDINAGHILLFQLFWMIPVAFLSLIPPH